MPCYSYVRAVPLTVCLVWHGGCSAQPSSTSAEIWCHSAPDSAPNSRGSTVLYVKIHKNLIFCYLEIKLQNSKKIKSSLEFRIDYNFKETFFFSNLYFQAKSVPEPEQSETVTAAKATDVEGRLSALLQETKELKVRFLETLIHCILYETNPRKFYFISFHFSNSQINDES